MILVLKSLALGPFSKKGPIRSAEALSSRKRRTRGSMEIVGNGIMLLTIMISMLILSIRMVQMVIMALHTAIYQLRLLVTMSALMIVKLPMVKSNTLILTSPSNILVVQTLLMPVITIVFRQLLLAQIRI